MFSSSSGTDLSTKEGARSLLTLDGALNALLVGILEFGVTGYAVLRGFGKVVCGGGCMCSGGPLMLKVTDSCCFIFIGVLE